LDVCIGKGFLFGRFFSEMKDWLGHGSGFVTQSPESNPNWRPSAACDCASVAACKSCPALEAGGTGKPMACGERRYICFYPAG